MKFSTQSCPHRPPCPGCPRFGESGISSAAAGALEALAQRAGLPPVRMISGRYDAFRLRARLAIRGHKGSPKLGLFELGTHRVVHIPNCSIQHPLINRVAATVRRALVDAQVTCFSDKAHLGIARYLQVVVERRSQTAQVVLVANSESADPLETCFGLIRERLGSELHSLWFNANLTGGNTVLGSDFHRCCGPPSVVEHFGGAAVHYPPGAFGQSNLEIAQLIIDHVRAQIPAGARIAEFYAGVGAIALSVLDRVAAIHVNEIGAASLEGLALGMAQLDAVSRAKLVVVPGAAGAASAMAASVDVVIADPPRKGLDAELTMQLAAAPPQRFIYVSCDLDSLLRDAEQLTAPRRLKLASLTAFNLMPFTEHVETVACFERV